MEAQRFDELARSLTTFASRRRSVGGVLAGLLALVVPSADAETARHGKGKSNRERGRHNKSQPDKGDDLRALTKSRNKKKETLCHNGQTIVVSKKVKKKFLRRGATLGACLPGGDGTLPLTLEPVDAATRDALWSAANQSADYNTIADRLSREEQMFPSGAFDVQRLHVRQEIARTVLTTIFANTQGRQAVLAFGVEATGEEWAYAFASMPDGSTSLVYIEGTKARQVDAEKAAQASSAGHHARFFVGAESVSVCEGLGTLCSDISEPCFQCKAICSITASVVTGIGTVGCTMAVASLCGPVALACAAAAFIPCAALSAIVVGTPCFEGCKLLNYCKVCRSLGESCSGDTDCCDNPVIHCLNAVCQTPAGSCVSKTCQALGLQCGNQVPDNCGRAIDCGNCPNGGKCNLTDGQCQGTGCPAGSVGVTCPADVPVCCPAGSPFACCPADYTCCPAETGNSPGGGCCSSTFPTCCPGTCCLADYACCPAGSAVPCCRIAEGETCCPAGSRYGCCPAGSTCDPSGCVSGTLKGAVVSVRRIAGTSGDTGVPHLQGSRGTGEPMRPREPKARDWARKDDERK